MIINTPTLTELKNLKTGELSNEEIETLKRNKPVADLSTNESLRSCGRLGKFNIKCYDDHKWIAGCEIEGKIFCFLCVLSKAPNKGLAQVGTEKISSIHSLIKSHEESKTHSKSLIAYKNLGEGGLLSFLRTKTNETNLMRKEEQDKNYRYTVAIFRAVVLLGRQGLAFRETGDKNFGRNEGNFIELLEYTKHYSPILAEYSLKNDKLYKSPQIQNEMIEITNEYVVYLIKEEIKTAKFFSVVADESTDLSKEGQLIVSLKYIYNNEVKERLIGLENISRDKTAANITNKILNCLQEFGVEKNLISQSFDGAPVMSGRFVVSRDF